MEAYTLHKPIRNKLAKYDPLSIISFAINKLHTVTDNNGDPSKWGGYLPWNLLLLIRWSFQYGFPCLGLPAAPESTCIDLLEAIGDLHRDIVLDGQERDDQAVPAFFRRIIGAQLPFQFRERELSSALGRQLILFCDLGRKYDFDQRFAKIAGISISDFLKVYFCCWAGINAGDEKRLTYHWFNGKITDDVLVKFFSCLSKDVGGAKSFLLAHTNSQTILERKKIDFQLHETTPLERFPFLNISESFVPYSKKLFLNSFSSNVYEILREDSPQEFGNDFGNIFQEYVKNAVSEIEPNLLAEEDIKSITSSCGSVADFLIEGKNASVLIEVKSTKLHPVARVYHTKSSILFNFDENPLVKAIKQILKTAHDIKNANRIQNNTPIYGLVLTYGDYYIGYGKQFWDSTIGCHIRSWAEKDGISLAVEPERLIFISVDDFDCLMGGLKEHNIKIEDVLEYVVRNDAKPDTRCILFRQHLQNLWKCYHRPNYLKNRMDAFFEEIDPLFR